MGYAYEIFGTKGAIRFDQEDQNALWLYRAEGPEAERGFRKILTGPAHPDYLPFCQGPGHGTGYQDQIIIEARDFLAAIHSGQPKWPSFEDGLAVWKVVDAAARSSRDGRWVTVEPAMESVGTKIVTGEGAIATVKPAIKSVREAKEPSLHDLMNGEKLTLVSMGSPLRQLYALRFPDLYRWVEAKPGPVPAALHLKQWINFYRSGDYVGRGIWQANDHNGWQIGEHPTAVPAVTEICIGIGAHTHYWDETADSTVGTMLDSLISAPASSGEPQ